MRANEISLADVVRAAIRDRGLTYGKVVGRARRAGYKLSQSTISDIINGKYSNVSGNTLNALAAGLDRPVEELVRALHGQPPTGFGESDVARIWEKIQALPPGDREFVKQNLKLLEGWIDDRLDIVERRPA